MGSNRNEQVCVELMNGEKRQQLCSQERGGEEVLVLMEGNSRLRSWPLRAVRIIPDQPMGGLTLEVGGETLRWSRGDMSAARSLCRAVAARPLNEEALTALLQHAAPLDAEPELWVRRLSEQLANLDALNVQGMLSAATEAEGAGARLWERLGEGCEQGAALGARLRRLEALARGAADAGHARSGAARADANARALLAELEEIYRWLDAPPLADLDNLPQISLASAEGRSHALEAARALRGALRAEGMMPVGRRRLGAVRQRLRRLRRARDQLAVNVARHLNNLLIHLGNEATAMSGSVVTAGARKQHLELLPYADLMLWLREMDERAYSALIKVYTGTWSRVYEREIRASCDTARGHLASAPDAVEPALREVLTLVENLCSAEQEFSMQFFHLDVDVKSDSDGEKSEKSGESETGSGGGGGGVEGRRGTTETRRLMGQLFPTLEQELVALVSHIDALDELGAMRALACIGRRVLGESAAAGVACAEGRWAVSVAAAAAVAAKRGADRSVAAKIAALPNAVKQAAKRAKCGILSFISELEELSENCERIFAGGRRADLERWYVTLAHGMVRAIAAADHPRTPRAVLHMENYHRLHAVLSTLRVSALDPLRRECKTRYAEALKSYVTQYFGRPLEKLTQFFEGVGECVSSGVREDEVCYRAAFSKHQLRRILALYPPDEVRKSLHRLYRTVEKHLSEEGGLLQVVWRAMQEEFLSQYRALQARMAACYAGAGLALPLSTQDILDAFSDIAREH